MVVRGGGSGAGGGGGGGGCTGGCCPTQQVYIYIYIPVAVVTNSIHSQKFQIYLNKIHQCVLTLPSFHP